MTQNSTDPCSGAVSPCQCHTPHLLNFLTRRIKQYDAWKGREVLTHSLTSLKRWMSGKTAVRASTLELFTALTRSNGFVSLCAGVATEELTTRTHVNHCSVALHNNGPAALTESVALLTTATNQDSEKLKDSGEVSSV